MTDHTERPGRRPGSLGSDGLDRHGEPLQVRVEVITVGGQEGAALRAAQAKIIRELLMWVADEDTDTA